MINSKGSFINNAKIAMFSQFIVLAIGIIRSLIIPIYLSVSGYGCWQIYMLYLPYIGFCYLGFNDGIYLRYGKFDKENLPYNKIRSSVWLFLFVLVFECIFLLPIAIYFNEIDKAIALVFVLINIPVQGINGTMIYILQVTNQIKKYCFYTLIDKVIFLLYLLFFITNQYENFAFLIIADTVSRLISTVLLLFENKNLFIGKFDFKEGKKEFEKNVKTGFSLMIAAFLSMLFTGIGRTFIELSGNINEYAYYSFGMSVINLLLTCFISISTVIYPVLKRTNKQHYGIQFNIINTYFECISNASLFSYFICYFIILVLFNKYSPVLNYLNVLFCLAIFQGKINLINNTYYKVLREEKKMMKDNILSTALFFLVCCINQNVVWIATGTALVMCHRCYDTEVFLRKKLNILKDNKIKQEILMIIIFLLCSIDAKIGLLVYTIYFLIYFFINKKNYISLLIMLFPKLCRK